MRYLKKAIIIISLIWTALSVGYIGIALLSGSSSCEVNDDEPVKELSGELPDFEFELMDENTTVTNESIKGSYTLIYFWSTSCSICVKEMPYLHETYEQLKNRNFEIIAVSYNKREKTVRDFRNQQYPMPWKHSVMGDNREEMKKTFRSFGFQGSPHKVLVSPEGKVLETISGFSGEDLTDKIQAHLTS